MVRNQQNTNAPMSDQQPSPTPTFLLEVWSILLVLMEYVRSTEYCLVALIDIPLGERIGDDNDNNDEIMEVLGRACGDRVAVVNVGNHDTSIEFVGTVAHEILHCMGLDHTTTEWQCLMNPSVNPSSPALFLAPHNLKKIQLFFTTTATAATTIHDNSTKHNKKRLRQQENKGNDEEEVNDLTFAMNRYQALLDGWDSIFASCRRQNQKEIESGRRWLEGIIKYLASV